MMTLLASNENALFFHSAICKVKCHGGSFICAFPCCEIDTMEKHNLNPQDASDQVDHQEFVQQLGKPSLNFKG